MAAADPRRRTASASIAANSRWAMVPNRSEATTAARSAAPQSIEYWRKWAKQQHPDASPADQLKAAQNAYSAHMRKLALKAATKRAAAKEQKSRRSTAA